MKFVLIGFISLLISLFILLETDLVRESGMVFSLLVGIQVFQFFLLLIMLRSFERIFNYVLSKITHFDSGKSKGEFFEQHEKNVLIKTFDYHFGGLHKRLTDLQQLNEELTHLVENKQSLLSGNQEEKKNLEKFLRKLVIAMEHLPFPLALLDSRGRIIFQKGIDRLCNHHQNLDSTTEPIPLTQILQKNKISGWDHVSEIIDSRQDAEIQLVCKNKQFKKYWKLILIPYEEREEENKKLYFLALFVDITGVKVREKIFEYLQKISYIATRTLDEGELYRVLNLLLFGQFKIKNYFILKKDEEKSQFSIIHATHHEENYAQFLIETIRNNFIDILHTGGKEIRLNVKQQEENSSVSEDRKQIYAFTLNTDEAQTLIIVVEWDADIHRPFMDDFKLLFEQFLIILSLYHEHRRLMISEMQFKKLFDESQTALLEYDQQGNIYKCNQSAVDLLDCQEKEELINKNFFDFFGNKDDVIFYQHMMDSIGFVKDYETNIKSLTGRKLTISLSVTPMKNPDDRIVGYRASLYDLTSKALVEEMLIKKNRELEELNQKLKETQAQLIHQEKLASIGQLAAGIAHEINNPLGFVYSNFGTLRKYVEKLTGYIDEINEKIKEFGNDAFIQLSENLMRKMKVDFIKDDIQALFEDSEEGFDRITKIVQNMRTFSRVDYSEEKEEYDLNQGIESTLIVAKNVYKYYAEIEKNLGDIPSIPAVGNEINQVLLNIITNAAQAIKGQNRSEKGKISIKTYEEEQFIVCEIADDGPGIPEKYLNKIFDPFFTTKPEGEGTGLGLHISYDIVVNKHKGVIKVNTREGEGTTFIIKLPKVRLDNVHEDQKGETDGREE